MGDARKCWVLSSLLVVIGLIAIAASARAEGKQGVAQVKLQYVHAERLFVGVGKNHGLRLGQVVEIRHKGTTIARAEVIALARSSCAMQLLASERQPIVGDLLSFSASKTPKHVKKSTKTTRYIIYKTPKKYPKIRFRSEQKSDPVRRHEGARLRSRLWLDTDSAELGAQHDALVDLWWRGDLDRSGRWRGELDAQARVQSLRRGNRDWQAQDRLSLQVYRASLSYHGLSPYVLGLGRTAVPGLRYGRLDGLRLDWRSEQGEQSAFVFGGRRLRNAGLDLRAPEPYLALGYRHQLRFGEAWLGLQSQLGFGERLPELSSGLEASASADLVLGRQLYVNALAGGGLTFASAAGSTARYGLDRLSLGASYRWDQGHSLRASVRRVEDLGLDGVAGPEPLAAQWVASTGGRARLVRFGQNRLDLSLDAGLLAEENGQRLRYWASPSLLYFAPSLGRALFELGYRFEGGELGQHLALLGVSFSPIESLFIDLRQEGGVQLDDRTHQVMPYGSTWLRSRYRVARFVEAGLRLRALYGFAGNGGEASGWLGIVDPW